jgi:metal-responsive CopG/Arc/MetJ family transcriptional regulator
MALNVSLSVSIPPELIDELDEMSREDESRSATVRRLIRKEQETENGSNASNEQEVSG